jgi:hypothetical protein
MDQLDDNLCSADHKTKIRIYSSALAKVAGAEYESPSHNKYAFEHWPYFFFEQYYSNGFFF